MRMRTETARRVLLNLFAILCCLTFVACVQFTNFILPLRMPFDPWLHVHGVNSAAILCSTLLPSAFTILVQSLVAQSYRVRLALPFCVWVVAFSALYGISYVNQLKRTATDVGIGAAMDSMIVRAIATELVWFAFLAIVFAVGSVALVRNPYDQTVSRGR